MKKKLEKTLKNLDVVIASHIYATGPALELEEYLKDKVRGLVFIGHPLFYSEGLNSFFRYHKNGYQIFEKKLAEIKIPQFFAYFKEAFVTIFWVLTKIKKVDIFIGSDGFMAFIGLILKRIGKVKRVILYTIDYSPKRFNNLVLNFIYHYLDRRCLKKCDIIWNVSEKIKAGRRENGIDSKKCKPQITVPLGVWLDRISYIPVGKRKKHSIIFLGHLLEKQGLQESINAVFLLKDKFKDINLTIIGDGPYKKHLEDLSFDTLFLKKQIRFLGFIKDHRTIEKILSTFQVAIATYLPIKSSFTYYADPGKVKNYLAAGVPVIITNVPEIAREIESKKCGFIVNYNNSDIAGSIEKIFLDRKLLDQYSKNAREYAKEFDWNNIFYKAFNLTYKEFNKKNNLI